MCAGLTKAGRQCPHGPGTRGLCHIHDPDADYARQHPGYRARLLKRPDIRAALEAGAVALSPEGGRKRTGTEATSPGRAVRAPAKTTERKAGIWRTVAVDGSALRNGFGGPAAWCVYEDAGSWAAGGWPQATNNQAELTAVLEALRRTSGDLTIISDSQYAIDCSTRYARKWQRNGWRLTNGDPVKNREIIEAIVAELAGRDVEFEHVRGHSGHRLNEAADTHARAFSTCLDADRRPDDGPGLRDNRVQSMPAVHENAFAGPHRRPDNPARFGRAQQVRPPARTRSVFADGSCTAVVDGRCAYCTRPIRPGIDRIKRKAGDGWLHIECWPDDPPPSSAPPTATLSSAR